MRSWWNVCIPQMLGDAVLHSFVWAQGKTSTKILFGSAMKDGWLIFAEIRKAIEVVNSNYGQRVSFIIFVILAERLRWSWARPFCYQFGCSKFCLLFSTAVSDGAQMTLFLHSLCVRATAFYNYKRDGLSSSQKEDY